MGLNIHKLKKWSKMVNGSSILHVEQDIGKAYSVNSVKGYYNDMTKKVLNRDISDCNVLPTVILDSGEEIHFLIDIFQYGLGSYDLFLLNDDRSMLKRVITCADWAIENQQENGAWLAFSVEHPQAPFSSMAQGEGISLLLRAYISTNDNKYSAAAVKAKEYMLKSISDGGTAVYDNDDVYFYEYTNRPIVLNGWIFSLWGLFDYIKIYPDDIKTVQIYNKSINTLIRVLPEFDMGYWSKYEHGKMICSPFYQRLHVAQMQAMADITKNQIFAEYQEKWENDLNNNFKKTRAFVIKAAQKISE